MNNLLLVGNGFDLAHGLLTKYEHFLYLMKTGMIFILLLKMKEKKTRSKKMRKELK